MSNRALCYFIKKRNHKKMKAVSNSNLIINEQIVKLFAPPYNEHHKRHVKEQARLSQYYLVMVKLIIWITGHKN